MSDEIEFIEENQEDNAIEAEEAKRKKTNRSAVTVASMIGIQLSGAGAIVLYGAFLVGGDSILAFFGFIETSHMGDTFAMMLAALFNSVLLSVNAWMFYLRGKKVAGLVLSLYIYIILFLSFGPNESQYMSSMRNALFALALSLVFSIIYSAVRKKRESLKRRIYEDTKGEEKNTVGTVDEVERDGIHNLSVEKVVDFVPLLFLIYLGGVKKLV